MQLLLLMSQNPDLISLSLIIVLVILSIQSYWDLKYKEIPLVVTLVGIVFGVVIAVVQKREILELMSSLTIGLIFLVLGKITRQAIGYGDGLLLCMMGVFYSAESMWTILLLAVFLAGMFALCLLIFFHKNKKFQIPFVPFLWIGNLIYFVCSEVQV